MPYKDKEKEKEYARKWREQNKECIRLWREENKEYLKKKSKEYYKTENGIKANIINTWKYSGVKNDDLDKLYDYYLNCKNCEECNVELISGNKGNNRKCLDHDHKTGWFRNVVCNTCNIKRGYRDRGHIPLTKAERDWKCKLKKFILS